MLILGKGKVSAVSLDGYSVDDNEILYVIDSDGVIKSIDNEGQEVSLNATPSDLPPSLSDYQNVIVVDAGGAGDYDNVKDAIENSPADSTIIVHSCVPDSGAVTITKRVMIVGQLGQSTLNGAYNIPTYAMWQNSFGISIGDGGALYLNGMTVVAPITSSSTGFGASLHLVSSVLFTRITIAETFKLALTALNSTIAESGTGYLGTIFVTGATASTVAIYLKDTAVYKKEFSSSDIVLERQLTLDIDNCTIGKINTTIQQSSGVIIRNSKLAITSGVAWTNANITHCELTSTPTNITVKAGNYSNTLSGVTWPTIP